MIDQTFDRLQKLVSQLELLVEKLSQEDVNQKLLRSLSPELNTHAVVWRNKADLDTMSMDDLYNNLKVYEPKVKGMSSSSSSTQNMAFVSSLNNNTSSTNRAVNTTHGSPNSPQYPKIRYNEDLATTGPAEIHGRDGLLMMEQWPLECYRHTVPAGDILLFGECRALRNYNDNTKHRKVKKDAQAEDGPICECPSGFLSDQSHLTSQRFSVLRARSRRSVEARDLIVLPPMRHYCVPSSSRANPFQFPIYGELTSLESIGRRHASFVTVTPAGLLMLISSSLHRKMCRPPTPDLSLLCFLDVSTAGNNLFETMLEGESSPQRLLHKLTVVLQKELGSRAVLSESLGYTVSIVFAGTQKASEKVQRSTRVSLSPKEVLMMWLQTFKECRKRRLMKIHEMIGHVTVMYAAGIFKMRCMLLVEKIAALTFPHLIKIEACSGSDSIFDFSRDDEDDGGEISSCDQLIGRFEIIATNKRRFSNAIAGRTPLGLVRPFLTKETLTSKDISTVRLLRFFVNRIEPNPIAQTNGTQKPLLKDEDGEEVDVHMYRSMIGSLMYLTSSRPDIMFAVCACARYQVNPKVSHLHAVRKWNLVAHKKRNVLIDDGKAFWNGSLALMLGDSKLMELG
ncbi:hypothetical protein Tco_1522900 [Tanacetum coccineum]